VTPVAVPWDDPDVRRLTAAQQAELRARYDGQGEPGRAPTAADVSVLLLLRDDDGTAIGCGALRALGDGVAELKRVYVVPGYRGIEAFGVYAGDPAAAGSLFLERLLDAS